MLLRIINYFIEGGGFIDIQKMHIDVVIFRGNDFISS